MAFAVRRGEANRRAVRRMARRELEKARAAWTRPHRPLHARAHDVRTAIKKVRGLIGLVRPVVGSPARKAERDLRRTASTLGPIRDAKVMLATFDELVAASGLERNPGARQVRERLLRSAQREVRRPRTRKALERVDDALRRSRRRVDDWIPGSGGWSAVSEGLEESYRRVRRAMKRAYRDVDGESFHAWRRSLKTHRHQLRALEPLWPRALDARIAELGELDNHLGREHDLTVLEEKIQEERACFSSERHCAPLLAELEQQRDRLREQMRPLGARLFAEKPAAFRRRVHRYFDAFRNEPPGISEEALDPESRVARGRLEAGSPAAASRAGSRGPR
jgi:CHAD domain-containing protein